jgi:hypothetical protein
MEAGRNTDSITSPWGMEVAPSGQGKMLPKNLERRQRMNMKIVTGFRKIRASNTPETYQYPRLFPETGSLGAGPYWLE